MPETPPADRPPGRPVYRDGAVLRAADLRDEAAARLAADRRHQELAHRPGILAGLLLLSRAGRVVLSPGMAVDGFGRWVLVPTEVRLGEDPAGAAVREVWLAYREAPTDPTDPPAPPGRFADRFEVLFHPPGLYDPADPAADPEGAVFVGTVAGGDVSDVGRRYAAAAGARVESASRTSRLLLAPERPGDPRQFALGTRSPDAPGSGYTDHVALESSGVLRLNSPADVAARGAPDGGSGSIAAVVAGHHPIEFETRHVVDAAAVAGKLLAPSGVGSALLALLPAEVEVDGRRPEARKTEVREQVRRLLATATGDRLAGLVCRVLNLGLAVAAAKPDCLDKLIAEARKAGAVLRPRTVRGLLDRDAGLPRADAARLARLLVEDAFPGFLAPSPDDGAAPRGVVFAGTDPEKLPARGRVYLAEVADKAGSYQELRVVFEDPGKENHPDRYKVSVGVVGPDGAGRSKTAFAAALTVDASRTVTLPAPDPTRPARLCVYASPPSADSPATVGLILKRTPPEAAADPNDPAALAARLALVSPDDLRVHVLEGSAVARPGTKGPAVVIGPPGYLKNEGKAPILGVRLDAVAFSTGDTKHDPVRRTLLQNLTIGPGETFLIRDPELELPFTLPLGAHAQAEKVSVVLLAVGAGPGGILAGDKVRWDEPAATSGGGS
jgi:hypothetical protein